MDVLRSALFHWIGGSGEFVAGEDGGVESKLSVEILDMELLEDAGDKVSRIGTTSVVGLLAVL